MSSAAQPAEHTPVQWEVEIDLVDVNDQQPRDHFDEEKIAALAASIAEVGVLQPILVRPRDNGRYELVSGERRLRASKDAGRLTIPAVLRDARDAEMLPLAVVENLHREGLNAIELAEAYAQMIADSNLTQAELAGALHVDRTHVTRTLALLKLPEKVRVRVAAGVLSASHAELLASLPDPYVVELLARRIVAEGLSVASVRELIAVGGLPGIETVDGRQERMRRRRLPPAQPEHAQRAASALGDLLDTRVRVMSGKSRGRIVVDFSDPHDLERIMALLVRSGA